MMNKERFYQLIVVVLLSANIYLMYQTKNGLKRTTDDRRPPREHRSPKHKIIKALKFDEAQIKTFEKLIDQHRKDIKQYDNELRQLKKQLLESLTDSLNSDQDDIYAQMGHVQGKIEKRHYSHFIAIKDLCREDQMEDFQTLSRRLVDLFSMRKPSQRRNVSR